MVLAIVGGACDDDGGSTLTLEEYFKTVEAVVERFGADTDAIVRNSDEAAETADTLSEDIVSVWRRSVEELGDLHPPADVESDHNAAVEARQIYSDALEDYLSTGNLPENSIDDKKRSNHPCIRLQRTADANGIDVELQCLT